MQITKGTARTNFVRAFAGLLLLGAAYATSAYETRITTGLSASSPWVFPGYPPSAVLDGHATTTVPWSSGMLAPTNGVEPYIDIHLGGAYYVTRIDIAASSSDGASAAKYAVQGILNGTPGPQVEVTGRVYTGWSFSVPVLRLADTIRITIKQSGNSWANLAEVVVYRGESDVPSGNSGAPQFVAKLYTEALGRVPTQANLSFWEAWIASHPTCWQGVWNFAAFVYKGPDFLGRNYEAKHRLMALYRGALSREPDSGGFNNNLPGAASNWPQFVDNFLADPGGEFLAIANRACDKYVPGYGFRHRLFAHWRQGFMGSPPTVQAIPLGPPQPNLPAEIDAQAAQALIDNGQGIPEGTLVKVDAQIIVGSGKVLRTQFYGSNVPAPPTGSERPHYLRMARFVPAGNFYNGGPIKPMISVQGTGQVRDVWLDGGRGDTMSSDHAIAGGANIEIVGPGLVQNIRSDNAAGYVNVASSGPASGVSCSGQVIRDSLFTNYSGGAREIGRNTTWQDALNVFCNDVLIEGNDIVDATDGAIVLFSGLQYPQKSKVRSNYVLNAGNNAYWGIVWDPHTPGWMDMNYSGAEISSNTLVTSSMAHIATMIGAGTKSLLGNQPPNQPQYSGAHCREYDAQTGTFPPCTISGNVVAGRMAIGIGLSGMTNVTIVPDNIFSAVYGARAKVDTSAVQQAFSCARIEATQSSISKVLICNPDSTDCDGADKQVATNVSCYGATSPYEE